MLMPHENSPKRNLSSRGDEQGNCPRTVKRSWVDQIDVAQDNDNDADGFTTVGKKRGKSPLSHKNTLQPQPRGSGESRTMTALRHQSTRPNSAVEQIKASRQLLDRCHVRYSKSNFDQMVFLEFLQEFSPVDYIDALEDMLGKDCVHQLAKMSGQILVGLSRKKLNKITLNGLPFDIEDSDVIKALRPFYQDKNLGSQLAAPSSQPTAAPATTRFTPAPPAIEVSAICDPVAVVSDPTPATIAEHETSSEKEKIVENKTTLTDEESLHDAKTREQKQLAAVLRKTSSKLFEEARNVR
ncbi:hypothetical protein LAZ67_3002825 [Cordylochernes scorpioides]|uniref:Uncharacterized protein n=1 Tax=Cordylochernes scorpioides TaxID=51811 RepID=A0ABY6KBE4_9ARAC|nr:hypothetical protein LAZ67_3002825 [Cordylochernes scorpioides]